MDKLRKCVFFIAKEKGYSTQNYVTKKQLNSDKKINNANTEKSHKCVVWLEEKKGFEPSNDLHRYSISNAAPSTTRPPLRLSQRLL